MMSGCWRSSCAATPVFVLISNTSMMMRIVVVVVDVDVVVVVVVVMLVSSGQRGHALMNV